MRTFSKSNLMALRQCPKRLWYEVHQPELRLDSAKSKASFKVGDEVGAIARQLYDPADCGVLVDVQSEGMRAAFERSAALLQTPQPTFEAGFSAKGAKAFADVMLPEQGDAGLEWRMVEVKSATSVKEYHRDDLAVQAFVACSAGVALKSIALAHIDSTWVYPGHGDYRGLLAEHDLSQEAFSRHQEVESWIAEAGRVCAGASAPAVKTGAQCSSPFRCGFLDHCRADEPQAEHPIAWLPRLSNARAQTLAELGVIAMEDVPDDQLNAQQLRVKKQTIANAVHFDATGAAADLANHSLPAYFLDFETIQFAVPIWAGTRPYQQITVQFSLHVLDSAGRLEQTAFLDISGNDPSEAFAHSLIASCGQQGPVYVYNAGFETARINELAARYPTLAEPLKAINARVVDLLPIARDRYYNPSQKGSWSIKKVLHAVVPKLSYEVLDGVQDGGMAMTAFLEAIHPDTSSARKMQIEQQLLAYCKLDTYAMVRIWQVFAGRTDLEL